MEKKKNKERLKEELTCSIQTIHFFNAPCNPSKRDIPPSLLYSNPI